MPPPSGALSARGAPRPVLSAATSPGASWRCPGSFLPWILRLTGATLQALCLAEACRRTEEHPSRAQPTSVGFESPSSLCPPCADCSQCAFRYPQRGGPLRSGKASRRHSGSVAIESAPHPTRLETRTKESNTRASQWAVTKPRGAMKVEAFLGGAEVGSRFGKTIGRTAGPSLCRSYSRRGGARAHALGPERW